jgi:aspartate/methionine/tyrosine aminotransferase
MKFERFELERIQSEWEHKVKYNLSESGVAALRVKDLIGDGNLQQQFLDQPLGYPQTNGSIPLRELIGRLYGDLSSDHITVTNGGAEANFISLTRLNQDRGNRNEMVILIPNYMQLWGLGNALNYQLKPFHLQASGAEWVPDIDDLKRQVSKKTHLIAICNPNNPTGAVMGRDSLKAIAEVAQDFQAWVLSDEVYRGAELNGPTTPSMLEFHEQTLVTSGLSKAYGLPGLRIGWVASQQKDFIYDLWSLTDYTSIAPSTLSDALATIALQLETRTKILERTRTILRTNWPIVQKWLDTHQDLVTCIPPKAAAICLPRYHVNIESEQLAHRLIQEKSVLIPPGDHFRMPRHLRIGFGYNTDKLTTGLNHISDLLQSLT